MVQLSDERFDPESLRSCSTLSRSLENRTLLQEDQAELEDQNLHRHERKCGNESDLDSCDRNAADGVTPLAFQVRLGVLQTLQVPSPEPIHI